jgi:hypothetical protein
MLCEKCKRELTAIEINKNLNSSDAENSNVMQLDDEEDEKNNVL